MQDICASLLLQTENFDSLRNCHPFFSRLIARDSTVTLRTVRCLTRDDSCSLGAAVQLLKNWRCQVGSGRRCRDHPEVGGAHAFKAFVEVMVSLCCYMVQVRAWHFVNLLQSATLSLWLPPYVVGCLNS